MTGFYENERCSGCDLHMLVSIFDESAEFEERVCFGCGVDAGKCRCSPKFASDLFVHTTPAERAAEIKESLGRTGPRVTPGQLRAAAERRRNR